MPGRTIGVMGRVLDQEGGLGVYARCLVPELLRQDPHTRYVIFLSTEKSRDLLRRFPNAEPHVLPGRNKLYWDQVTSSSPRASWAWISSSTPSSPFPCCPDGLACSSSKGRIGTSIPRTTNGGQPVHAGDAAPVQPEGTAHARHLPGHAGRSREIRPYRREPFRRHLRGGRPNITAERDPQALAEFRAKHQLPERFILTVTRAYHSAQRRLIPYPGGNDETLLRAYRRYRAHGGELPLVVVGFRIMEYLCERGFSERDLADVHFLGLVPNAEMHLAYQSAECFVLASLCESFGIKILEALATGCPAIVPTTCASPEIAGSAARLVNPHDEKDIAQALAEVTGSEELRPVHAGERAGRARALTWQDTARRTLAVFDEIIPRPVEAGGAFPKDAFPKRGDGTSRRGLAVPGVPTARQLDLTASPPGSSRQHAPRSAGRRPTGRTPRRAAAFQGM